MDSDFWHQRWKNNQIGFHENTANPLLVKHIDKLAADSGSRLFLPLCGKSLDIGWLLSNGYQVAGAELSEVAIQQLFKQLGLTPAISRTGNFVHYSQDNIDIYVGDFFALSSETVGPIDAIYDRAAIVALPEEMRIRYSMRMKQVANLAPQLIISFEYNQQLMQGPPFSVDGASIDRYYGDSYRITLVETIAVAGGLKGKIDATESVWLLRTD